MRTVPDPGDVLWQATDAIARTIAVREAVEARHHAHAAALARKATTALHALADQLERKAMRDTARDAGMTHLGDVVDAELERLNGLDAP